MIEKKWIGSKPVCDACGREPTTWFVDGQMPYGKGPWGLFCERCWNAYGGPRHLGSGVGQRYDAQTLRKLPNEIPLVARSM